MSISITLNNLTRTQTMCRPGRKMGDSTDEEVKENQQDAAVCGV